MKVTFAVPLSHGFPVPAPFVKGITDLCRVVFTGAGNQLLPDHLKIDAARFIWSHDFPTDVARNKLCELFLDHDNGDYLLFLDADMVHPSDLAHRLVAHQKDIVTARYQMRKEPFFSVAMQKTGDGPREYNSVDKTAPEVKGLMPIDAAGAGALLISRQVLRVMRTRIGPDWFRYQVGEDGLRSVSEDMWFFEQAKAAGYQAYLDADVHCGHLSTFNVTANWHAPYLEAYRQKHGAEAGAA